MGSTLSEFTPQIICLKEGDATITKNLEKTISLERGVSDPFGGIAGQTGGGIVGQSGGGIVGKTGGGIVDNGDDSKNNARDTCCCKVIINVTGGPVNVYVCSSEKSNIP